MVFPTPSSLAIDGTPEERRLFTLRYTAGYNASEIGQLLSLPPGTVRSRLAQIRHRLKTELTEE